MNDEEVIHDGEYPLRVLLPAYLIPLNSIVTKRTGEKEYVLRNDIKIYGEGGEDIKSPKDTLFLVSEGSINIIKRDTILLWSAEDFSLETFLEGRREGVPK